VARQRLGQHFLIRASILQRMARATCPEREPLVVEIGPGRGALTRYLLERADRVVTVEVDGRLAEYLRKRFAGAKSLEVIEADALQVDLGQWGRTVLAGNLPYYAASAVLERVMSLEPAMRWAVFLVQKEVAERVVATPGSRAYGYLSVAMQMRADAEVLFEVKPSAFHPPPKVDSAAVRCVPRDRAGELGIIDRAGFLRFVGLCFRQKRKTLRNNLAGEYGAAVDVWPEARLRAEQVSVAGFARMWRRVAGP
jgi:16S rRNA (adenine1518-N6/adenine1519-N6)-dimethyltransferase